MRFDMSEHIVQQAITYTVSGPQRALHKRYGDEIKKIHAAFEAAINFGHFSTDNEGDQYIEVDIDVEEILQPMFKRMYLESGWSGVSFRYFGSVRLFPPLPS
jgi:hypothetical protein